MSFNTELFNIELFNTELFNTKYLIPNFMCSVLIRITRGR